MLRLLASTALASIGTACEGFRAQIDGFDRADANGQASVRYRGAPETVIGRPV